MKKSNIVLTGFMGAGKSTVGKLLARKMNLNLVDTDEEIEKKTGMSIPEIFEKFGEGKFREIEAEVVKEVSKLSKTIIVTGGGVVLKKENINELRKRGMVVYLHAEPEVVYSRIKEDKSRPLLQSGNPLKRIKELMEFRKPFYKNYDIKVDTSDLSVEEVVDKIIKSVK